MLQRIPTSEDFQQDIAFRYEVLQVLLSATTAKIKFDL